MKKNILKLEQDLRSVAAWNPPEPINKVVASIPDDALEFHVFPWQLGCTARHRVKNKSKLVYRMDTVEKLMKQAV